MIEISKEYYKNDTVHKIIGSKEYYGNISCGFLHKKTVQESNIQTIFENYGGLLLLSGSGVHVDHKGKHHPLYPGCFIQRIPGRAHCTYVEGDGEWVEFFICFGRDVFENMVNMGIATKEQEVLYPGVSYGLLDTFNKLLEQFKAATDTEFPLLLFECQQIIYQIFLMHQKQMDENGGQMIELCEVLKGYLTHRMSLEEICSEIGIGYEKFRKEFKKQIGIAPTQYMVKERINLAKSLLLRREMAVKEVALTLGYADPFIFSKQFKEVTGLSPNEFRKIY